MTSGQMGFDTLRVLGRLVRVMAVAFGVAMAVAACSGVPLRSIPQLVQLPKLMLDAQPNELRVALQVDKALVPPPGAVPVLVLKMEPKDTANSSWQRVDRRWPLQLEVRETAPLGLPAVAADRRWLIYSLGSTAQAELRQIQDQIKAAQRDPSKRSGGTISVGVEQSSLATDDPKLLKSKWNTYIQVSVNKGYLEIWNGTLEDLKRSASKPKL